MQKLNDHPRLYIGQKEISRIKSNYTSELLKRASKAAELKSEEYSLNTDIDELKNVHNAHLIRARNFQFRVITLLVQWLRTDQLKYKDAVLDHFKKMEKWEFWSWISWRDNDPSPDSVWDLSYGENATTVAIAWDLLYHRLNTDEKNLLLGIAKKWIIPSFLKHTDKDNQSWWVDRHKSNWLAVCACGGGMAALSFYEDFDEAKIMLDRANQCITNFMSSLTITGGAWPEGVAYWNYGMRYAFIFLLSYEEALSKKHPSFDLPETLETLLFPPAFSPHGKSCGFGDISENPWRPIALHFAAANRLNSHKTIMIIENLMSDTFESTWATEAELMALHPGATKSVVEARDNTPILKLYPDTNWAYFTDKTFNPDLYVSIRGGTTKDPHNMSDLLSWQCLIKGEKLISSVTNHEYIDSTFGPRRFELAEIRPDTKNTIIIGGLGMLHPAETKSHLVEISTQKGLFIDATPAYQSIPEVEFVGRLFLFLDAKYLLIIDKVNLKHTNRIETRMHTYESVKTSEALAQITSQKESANLYFASNVPSVIATSLTTPTNLKEQQAKVIRWGTESLQKDVTFGTLLVPGNEKASLEIIDEQNKVKITAKIANQVYEFNLGKRLT